MLIERDKLNRAVRAERRREALERKTQTEAPSAEAFRFGGDEFCMLFRGVTKEQAAHICEGLIEDFGRIAVAKEYEPATMSFGIAQWDGTAEPSEFLKQADTALYRAKRSRGSVCVFDPEQDSA